MERRCTSCGVTKPITEFYKRTGRDGGYQWSCKQCMKQKVKDWRAANPGRYRARQRCTKHGLTVERYEEMLDAQGGKCAACRRRPAACVDHDHTCCPGERSCGECVRGLLCKQCNFALGLLQEDVRVIKRLARYLSAFAQ